MQSKRIAWMDVTRALAIILVVLCHAVETEYYNVRMGRSVGTPDGAWFFENILFTLGRLGVPLFLMLSGALLLGREHDIKSFYKRSLLPLFITTEIWTVINYFYYILLHSIPFSKTSLLAELLFFKSSQVNHMWFMPMILGMYLVVPLLSKAIKDTSFYSILPLLLIGFFAFSGVPLLNTFFGEVFNALPDISFVVNVAFLGGVYGLLFVMGHYLIQTDLFKRIPAFVYALTALAALACNTIGARYLYTKRLFHSDVFGWYTSPFIIIAAISLFALLSRLKSEDCPKPVSLISRGSFAIYLTHNLLLNFMESKARFYGDFNLGIRTLIRFAFSFLVPCMLVFVLSLLPFKKLKKLFFYMK